MTMIASFPSDVRETIEQIIHEIGRDVELFYVYSSYGCPICDLDPVTNTSVDSYCPVCSGTYWIDVYSGVTMSAHVTWRFDSQDEFETGGKYIQGDVRVKVMHTAEREQLIKNSSYLVVDGKITNVEKTTLLGTPINRIVIDLKEKEEG
jgi:hypothetical protein